MTENFTYAKYIRISWRATASGSCRDTIETKVIHVSADERRLGLSLKSQEPERKRGASEFRTGQGGVVGTNLGDMFRQQMEENAEGEEE